MNVFNFGDNLSRIINGIAVGMRKPDVKCLLSDSRVHQMLMSWIVAEKEEILLSNISGNIFKFH